jgi:hypothetical protein
MLDHVSWQQYITATALITTAWYTFVLLRYYRPEITGRLKTIQVQPPLVASPLGAIKTGNESRDSEELYFGPATPDDNSDAASPAEELAAEAQMLVQAFLDTPNKPEFLSLLGVLLSKYEPYEAEIDLKALRPLAAQLPFPIEEHEWPKF